MPLKVQTVQTGLEASIRKAVSSVNRRGGLNISVNDKQFTRPLGKITGSVSEFNKSLEASNARVLAFGASVGIIQGVQRAFASLLRTTVEVEKKLSEINVVMGITNKELEEMGRGLFKVAKNTAQSFSTVATAATELARQGLTMEETLKRTNDALILTRLTGLDAASAVSGLTAAINTFNKAGLDSTKILSKMAAVDVQFAVSTEDLIDGIARAGAVAQDAGVSFDQLLGAVTAAQQQTARGGKVIGNSFKTIFTRVQRASTIKRLEELGIAVRDVAGNTLPAIRVLENLSKTYDTLADTTKAAVAEQVGGVFQINILKAAIKDLAEENSILARATRIASKATDEAYRKNALLNQTISALTAQTVSSIEELSSVVGKIAFDEPIRFFLNIIKDGFGSAAEFLSAGESFGADIGRGLIKGLGNVISGPVMLSFLGVLVKLFGKTFSFLAGSMKELLGVTTLTQKQKEIQKTIVAVLSENSALQQKILSQEGNRAAQEKTILGILRAQSMEQQKIAAAAAAVGPAVMRAGFNQNLKKTRSQGHVPNYVSKTEASAEKAGAKSSGYTPGAVRSMNMPGQGRVVYNTAESVKAFPGMKQPAIMPPQRSNAGKNYKKAFKKVHGFNPYANAGFVPNYAAAMRYSPESASNIARALIYGGKTAMGLKVGPSKQLKDTWHSYGPAMATGTELNSIREKIYKNFILGQSDQRRHDINAALRNFGNNVPKSWGGSGDLVYGMVESLNSSRKSSRRLPMPYNSGFVPNYNMARLQDSATYVRGKLNPLQARSQGKLKDFILRRYGLSKEAREFEPPRFDLKMARDGKPVDMLDNPTASRARAAVITADGKTHLGYWHDDIRDDLARRKIDLKGAKDLELLWANSGFVPNYMKMLGMKDLASKAGGAAKSLMATPFKDAWSLAKGGYKGLMGVEHGLRAGLKGGYKGLQFGEKVVRGGLGKTFDFMKNFPRTTLYGGGGGLAYAFRDILPMLGNKAMSYGNQLIDLIAANPATAGSLIGALTTTGAMGAGMFAEALRAGKMDKITGGLLGKGKHRANTLVKDLPPDLQKEALNRMKPRGGPNSFVPKSILDELGMSGGFIPNMALRIKASQVASVGKGKVHSDKYDGTIGMKELDDILTNGKFKSLNYTSKSGNDLIYTKARWGVNQYKKGAPPPGNYVSYGEMDKATGTRSMWVGSVGEGADAFRKLKLNRIRSVVSQGRHLKVDPNLASMGKIPNFALLTTPFGPEYTSGLADAAPVHYNDRIIGKYETYKDPSKLNEILRSPAKTMDALRYLDNAGLEKVKNSMLVSGALGPADWSFVKQGVGKTTTANVAESLAKTPARELFNYLLGYTDRIQGNIPGNFIRLMDHAERNQVATDIVGRSSDVSNSVKKQIMLIKKSKNRMLNAQMETLIRDTPRLEHDPLRGTSQALRTANELRTKHGIGGVLAQMYLSGSGNISKSRDGFGDRIASGSRFTKNQIGIRDAAILSAEINRGAIVNSPTGTAKAAVLTSAIGRDQYSLRKAQELMDKENYSARQAAIAADVSSQRMSGVYDELFGKKKNRRNRPHGLKELLSLTKTGQNPSYIDRNMFSEPLSWETKKKFGLLTSAQLEATHKMPTLKDLLTLRRGRSAGFIPNFININPAFSKFRKMGSQSMPSSGGGPRLGAFSDSVKYSSNNLVDTFAKGILNGKLTLSQASKEIKETASWVGGKSGFELLQSWSKLLGNNTFKSKINKGMMSSGFIPSYSLFGPGAKNVLSSKPEFSNAVASAISREASFGVTPKVVTAPTLKSRSNPGLAVVNKEQEGGKLSNARRLHGRLNPKQGAAEGLIPNYAAPLNALDFLANQRMSHQRASSTGLRSIEKSFYNASQAIDATTTSSKKLKAEMQKAAISFGNTAKSAKEAQVRTQASRGNLSAENKGFARQLFRNDAAQAMMKDPSHGPLLKSLMSGGKLDERGLIASMATAKATGDNTTLRALQSLNKNLEKSARASMNAPKFLGQQLAGTLASQASMAQASNRVFSKDGGGYSRSDLNKVLLRDFLGSKGIDTSGMNTRAMNTIMMTGGQSARDSFSKFAQERGAVSSSGVLARGGLMKGEFGRLTTGSDGRQRHSSTFTRDLKSLEKAVSDGNKKQIKSLTKGLQKEAARIAANPAAFQRLESVRKEVQAMAQKTVTNTTGHSATSLRHLAQGNNVRAGFFAGMAGDRGVGSGAANRTGRIVGGFTGGMKNFAGRMGGMGGGVGIAASIGLPMLAGMVGPTRPRDERASFNAQSGNFEITEGAGAERASSTMMGAGIGALFGLPGMIAGAAIGFITSSKKMTLSIDEIVQKQEKQLQLLSRSVQAGTQLEGLMGTRAQAFGQGDEQGLKRIDAAINATLSQIADVETFDEMSNAMGNAKAMKDLNKKLQDRLSIDASIQNFSVATKNKDTRSQGLAFGNIVAQQISSGLLKEGDFKEAVAGIKNQRADLKSKGMLRTPEELAGIKRRASGDIGFFEGNKGVGLGVGIGAGLLTALGVALAPFTAGTSLSLSAVGLAAAAGGGAGVYMGHMSEEEKAKAELNMIQNANADSAQHLGKLADVSQLTERQFNALVAAFNKGNQEFDSLLKEVEKTVKANQKMRKESEKLSSRIFNLDKAFATSIANLKQEAQIKSIRSTGVGQRESSSLRFASQFSGFQGSDFQQRVSRRTISATEALRSSQIEANDLNSRAGFATKFQQKLKNTNLQVTQQTALLNKVTEEGFGVLRKQLNSGKITGTMDILGGATSPEDRFEIIQKMGRNFTGSPDMIRNRLSNQDDLSELKDLVSLSDQEIKDLTGKVLAASAQGIGGKFAQGAEFNVDFAKQADDATIKVIQDILSVLDRQKELEFEKIKVQQEALILQESQNIIAAKINELMTVQSMRLSLNASKEDNTLSKAKARSRLGQAKLEFSKDDIFRSGSSRQERKRQTDIQEKILNEQQTLQEKELAAKAKMEIRRLLSDQKVIFALNNLEGAVKNLLEPLTGKNSSDPVKSINLGLTEAGIAERNKAVANRTLAQQARNEAQKERDAAGSNREILQQKVKAKRDAFNDAQAKFNTAQQNTNSNRLVKAEIIKSARAKMAKARTELTNAELDFADSRKIDSTSRRKLLDARDAETAAQKEVERVSNDPKNQKIITLKDVQAEVDNVVRKMNNLKGGVNFRNTDAFAEQIEGITLSSTGINDSKAKLEELKALAPKLGASGEEIGIQIDLAIEAIETLSIASKSNRDMNSLSIKNQRLKNKVADFRVMSGSKESINRLNDLRDMDNISAGRISTIDRAVRQAEAEKAFEVLKNDPGASSLEVQNARLAAGRQSIGTKSQRDALVQMNSDFVRQTKAFSDAETHADREKARMAMESLEQSILELTSQMERTTPRDGGFSKEFGTNMNLGLGQGFAALNSQAESIYVKLGQELPFAFRDGLTNAMTLALNKADDLSGKIKEIGISLLQMVQQAFLQSASSRIVGSMQGLFGLGKAEGGYVSGGSGVRDDVPAMLMGGEYVIRKSAVQRYGSDFLNKINNGELPGYAKGGPVSLSIGSPRAAVRKASVDKNKYGDITTYETIKKDTGIDPRLSGYARANDRTVQAYFDDQEQQFREDLQTIEQTKRRKQAQADAKTKRRKAWQGALLGIVGGIAISKGLDWYKNTDFSKSRARKGITSQMDKKGFVQTKGRSVGDVFPNPDDAFQAKSFISKMAKDNPTQAAITASESGIKTSISSSGRVTYNASGGKVPAMLQGGEFVMNPSAVGKYGSSTMAKINNGTLGQAASGGSSAVNNSNQVNISINVDSGGNASQVSASSSMDDPKKFAARVKSAVLGVIQEEKRVGGSLR